MWDFINQEIRKKADNTEKSRNQSCYLKTGQRCPVCGKENLDYNSLLNLVCPACDYESAANFT